MPASNHFKPALIERYDVQGPRYTSYPTANHFHVDDFEAVYRAELARLADGAPLSLYVHVPFCATICYYCACNKIVTANHKHADAYVDHLVKEIALQASLAPPGHRVQQLHFGGGTPTFLDAAQMARVFAALSEHFDLSDDDERDFGIEIDPRKLAVSRIDELAALGLNRMSVGIQDFDPDVQEAVNRLQSEAETAAVVEAARKTGFGSINFDLIYGLPRQTPQSFRRTLERVIRLDPDRLSIYSYAHLPHVFKTQRQIDSDQLPSASTKLDLLGTAVECLAEAGYEYVGMDHFAKTTDSLIGARQRKRLHRNFQGYSTHGHCELIGLGVSSISSIGPAYAQNAKVLDDYYAHIDAGRLATERGYRLDGDDEICRAVIGDLMCDLSIDFDDFAREHGVDLRVRFAEQWPRLEGMGAEGLLTLTPDRLDVTETGRFLIRNICMVFDQYLPEQVTGFSKTI